MNFPRSFIKATREHSTLKKQIPASYFRRSFDVREGVTGASIVITGLGFYELYINGEKITKGYLAPYRSNIDHIVYYDRYDVTDKLIQGKNTVGILLGSGMRNSRGGFIWDFHKAAFRSAPITAFSVDIEYGEDLESVKSDKETKVAFSPIIFDDLHLGEYYDAREEIDGWALPQFDDSGWDNAIAAEPPRGEGRLCEAEPIVIHGSLAPISVTRFEDGYIYDFGVNTAGICRLKISGEKGQKAVLRHFETLVDGKPYLSNVRSHESYRFQEDEYTLKGEGEEIYSPTFTYHGFRYVYVTGITEEQATEELLTCLILASDIKKAGEFSCSNEIINKIQEATLRSDLANFYYFPTDCPQREKNGWTADASLSCEQMLFNFTPERSYKEWMRNICKALKDNGQLPGIIPTGGWGYHWGNGPAWDNVIVNLPYYTYLYRGDREILKELSIPLMRYLNYLFSRMNEDKTIAIGLGDWCQPGTKDSSSYKTPLAVTDTILTYDIAKKAAFIYEALGEEPQRQFALSLAKTVREGFRSRLLNKETGEITGLTQTGQAMAIYYDLLEGEEKDKAFKILLALIEKDGGHFNTGVLGGKVIYRVLAENGEGELAYRMIVREDCPSYGNWIKRGATSLWEAFWEEGGYILSMNHHFWGDISAWFYTYLCGIRLNPTGRDTENIDIRPLFIKELSYAKGYHDTVFGRISVFWERKGDEITLEIFAASAHHGVIGLPKGYEFTDGTKEKKLSSGIFKIKEV